MSRLNDPDIRKTLLWTFRSRWKQWTFLLVGNQLLPLLEVGLIFCIYTLISTEQRASVTDAFNLAGENFPAINGFTNQLAENPDLAMLAGALVLLSVFVVFRYLVLVRAQLLRYEFEISDSYSLTLGFLYATPKTARKTGRERVVSSIVQDAGTGSACVKHGIDIFAASWAVLIFLATAFATSWKIVLVILALYIVPLWVTRKTFIRMRQVGEVKNTAHENTLAFLGDLLASFDRSKIDALEGALSERAEKILRGNFSWRITKRKLEAMLAATMDGLSSFGLIVTLFVAVTILQLDLALLLVMFLLFNRMKSGVNNISVSYLNMQEILPNVKRLLTILQTLNQSATVVGANTERAEEPIRRIEARAVSFRYDPNVALIHKIDFVANAKDRILITGPSGHGKSTFLEILSGLLPPDEGDIYFNGLPLDTQRFYEYRDRIAFVSPTLHLFDTSLRTNITIGVPAERVKAALDQAIYLSGLKEVVDVLPDGLDSRIGVNGAELSVGQRQRVLLARLYLKQPDLVLLDEATANLDPSLESLLLNRLEQFLQPHAIVVMVAHKPPPNYRFTHHYRIENGRIALADMEAAE
ncbi:MAG: ABC transporter ATP-binding protein [Alphaproteobacteria bacterium]